MHNTNMSSRLQLHQSIFKSMSYRCNRFTSAYTSTMGFAKINYSNRACKTLHNSLTIKPILLRVNMLRSAANKLSGVKSELDVMITTSRMKEVIKTMPANINYITALPEKFIGTDIERDLAAANEMTTFVTKFNEYIMHETVRSQRKIINCTLYKYNTATIDLSNGYRGLHMYDIEDAQLYRLAKKELHKVEEHKYNYHICTINTKNYNADDSGMILFGNGLYQYDAQFDILKEYFHMKYNIHICKCEFGQYIGGNIVFKCKDLVNNDG